MMADVHAIYMVCVTYSMVTILFGLTEQKQVCFAYQLPQAYHTSAWHLVGN